MSVVTSPGDVEAGPRVGPTGEAWLDDDSQAAAALLGYRMMSADVEAERSEKVRRLKMTAREAVSTALATELATAPPEASPWRLGLAESMRTTSAYAQRAALAAAVETASVRVSTRPAGLAVLVELATCSPWPAGLRWVAPTRTESLEQVATEIEGLRSADVDRVEKEVTAQLRAMARAGVKWGKVAVAGVLGVGVGAATMGAAAPAIGAMLGSAAGLSGAAATSAGLATLGGGSLAAGGFGVFGGTAMLVGTGTLLGAGFGAGGARLTQVINSGALVRDVVRAEVYTRIVLIEDEADDEAARRVVVAMERRLEEVTGRLAELGARLRSLSREKKQLEAELAAERDKVSALLTENEDLRVALRTEQQQTALAQVALRISLKRLADATGGDPSGNAGDRRGGNDG